MKIEKKMGKVDISYCATPCEQRNCIRNSRYWLCPTRYCSMAVFDAENKDPMHTTCEDKWLVEN